MSRWLYGRGVGRGKIPKVVAQAGARAAARARRPPGRRGRSARTSSQARYVASSGRIRTSGRCSASRSPSRVRSWSSRSTSEASHGSPSAYAATAATTPSGDHESLRDIGASASRRRSRGVGHHQLGAPQPRGVEGLGRGDHRDRVVVGAVQVEVRRVGGAGEHERRVDLVGDDPGTVARHDVADPLELGALKTRPHGLCGWVSRRVRAPAANSASSRSRSTSARGASGSTDDVDAGRGRSGRRCRAAASSRASGTRPGRPPTARRARPGLPPSRPPRASPTRARPC